jgi:hypothetical protein
MVRNYESIARCQSFKLCFRWTGEGTSTSVPRVTTAATTNKLFSDFYVEDASYIRIQNIQLGYSLNPRYIEKQGFKVRLYAE